MHILVTGANSGLGLGICLRLIDDFLGNKNSDQSLNIIFTTRSSRKGSETLQILKAHLQKYHALHQRSRVTFQPENVELTNLLSIRDLARKLLSSDISQIDAIICNAGMAGWSGMDWLAVTRDILLDIRNHTTWPVFKLGTAGSITNAQLPASKQEQPLGEIFCANVFGHYMLNHWLMPKLRAAKSSKIIWVSSIEAQHSHFHESDFQGLLTDAPYEHSKRMTDLLALTYNQPSAAEPVSSFTAHNLENPVHETSSRSVTPTMHVYHPGVLVTSVVTLYWIVQQGYFLGILLARLLGNPWSTVYPYSAAHGATWLALTSDDEISKNTLNAQPVTAAGCETGIQDGKAKWGTSSSPLGKTTVRPTEVDRWGIRGTGAPYTKDWWGGLYGSNGEFGRGRKPGAQEARPQDVEEFIAQGTRVWVQMEELRKDWENRLEDGQ